MNKNSTQDIKSLLGQLVKSIIWSFPKFTQTKKDTFLFCTRRGGSTIISQMLGCNPGICYIDHTYSIYRAQNPTFFRKIPKKESGVFASFNDESGSYFSRLTEEIMQGKIRFNMPWKFWTEEYNLKYDCVVMKITSAKAVMGYFINNFNANDYNYIYITRHPIPSALSNVRNGYSSTIQGYIQDQNFVKKYLNQKQILLINETLKNGSELQKHVLNWIIENIVPLEIIKTNKDIFFLTYEELITDPDKWIPIISKKFDLPNKAGMYKSLYQASKSSKKKSETSTIKNIKAGNKMSLISGWLKKVDEEEKTNIQQLFNSFDINLYKSTDPFPIIE